jgi:hypothetical protein
VQVEKLSSQQAKAADLGPDIDLQPQGITTENTLSIEQDASGLQVGKLSSQEAKIAELDAPEKELWQLVDEYLAVKRKRGLVGDGEFFSHPWYTERGQARFVPFYADGKAELCDFDRYYIPAFGAIIVAKDAYKHLIGPDKGHGGLIKA